jgi:class 3 adenylate cyclase/pimeloyl-ACP methyl ester carboxylesterase
MAPGNVDREAAVTVPGEVRYARSGDLSIAYRLVGGGPLDLIEVSGFLNHLETVAEEPGLLRFVAALARFSRVMLFDKRGVGLSDRLPADVVPALDERIDDVRAVMDAVGSRQAVVLGIADGGPVAAGFAAAYPERTRALVLSATTPCGRQRPGYPWGPTAETAASWTDALVRDWGTGVMANAFADVGEEVRQVFARMERRACTPRAAAALVQAALETDVRGILSSIRAPTLVVHHPDHPVFPVGGARYMAEHIPGARYREHLFPFSPLAELCARKGLAEVIEEFLTGSAPPADVDRVLAAVLFTDIVDSTAHAAKLGDRGWHDVLDDHDHRVRVAVERAGGRVVKTTGDGVLARFDAASHAVHCAQAVVAEGGRLGLAVRAGVHAGECEVRGDDLAGMTVHVGARVTALAAAGEVLVTGTVRDLVIGSDLTFEERGRHALRGVPGDWTVLAVR